ncbi:MAG: hypothetical protein GKR89_01050 [Candidatus Latescibacteria bacterium]|nr:hypothetical protein [Candidatus Latescibacterota bacterium]
MLPFIFIVGAALMAPQGLAPAANRTSIAADGPTYQVGALDSRRASLPPGGHLQQPQWHPPFFAPQQSPSTAYSMPTYQPDPAIDYKMEYYEPVPGIDYKIRLHWADPQAHDDLVLSPGLGAWADTLQPLPEHPEPPAE